MQLIIFALLIAVLGYQVFKFIQVLVKLKNQPIFPLTDVDKQSVRKHPNKSLYSPQSSKQKSGIILHAGLLTFFITVAFVALVVTGINELNVIPFLPMIISLFYIHDTLNLFFITEKGIVSGSRFIPWKRMKYYSIEQIDINNKYYGYSNKFNDGYVFKIKLHLYTINCFIASDADDTKEKLETLLQSHIPIQRDLVSNQHGSD